MRNPITGHEAKPEYDEQGSIYHQGHREEQRREEERLAEEAKRERERQVIAQPPVPPVQPDYRETAPSLCGSHYEPVQAVQAVQGASGASGASGAGG